MSHPCHQYVKKLNARFKRSGVRFKWGNYFASLHKPHLMRHWHAIIDSGACVISCETPVIGRERFEQCDRVEPYLRFGIFNTSTLDRGGFVFPDRADDRRLEQVLNDCGVERATERSTGDAVLYILQAPFDTSLRGLCVERAAIHDLTELRRVTDRPILVIRHPYSRYKVPALEKFCEKRRFDMRSGPAKPYFCHAFATVSHSSSTAIDGILAGVPAVTLSPASFAYPCSVHRLDEIERASLDGCDDWLRRLVFCQWLPSEIDACLEHLRIALKNR